MLQINEIYIYAFKSFKKFENQITAKTNLKPCSFLRLLIYLQRS